MIGAGHMESDIVAPGTTFDGLEISRVPNWTGRGRLRLGLPIGEDGELFGLVTYAQSWGGFQTANNVSPLVEPELYELTLGLDLGQWRVAGRVLNLTDEDEPVSRSTGETVAREPRSWWINVTRRFGN
jgi:hypothetical protein